VVLSAGAVIFAGNAIVLSPLLNAPASSLDRWRLVSLLFVALLTSLLLVLSLLYAASVLVTSRGSRTLFLRNESVPPGLVFTASDTVAEVDTFARFKAVLETQTEHDIREAAQTELWICIRQHRYRYLRLRLAVRLLRYAAGSFVFVLAVLTINLLTM
jgi:hypothetical protein